MGATTIMVIRHAEKPGIYNGVAYEGVDATGSATATDTAECLITLGWERAGALVSLFAPPWGEKTLGLPQPQYIYAADPAEKPDKTDKTPSQRPYQTITAVAAKLGLSPNTAHKKKDLADMVTHALGKDGTVLICWQHEDIPAIGQAILQQTETTGISVPATWPSGPNGGRYDLIWVFGRSSGDGPVTAFSQVAQMLLPGDVAV